MNLLITTLPKALVQYPILRTYHLSESSMFYRTMNFWPKKLTSRIRVIVALEKDKPIGWAWLVNDQKLGSQRRIYHCWVFITPEHRQKGAGKLLVRKTHEIGTSLHKPIFCDPHDEISDAFFAKVPYKKIYSWATRRHTDYWKYK